MMTQNLVYLNVIKKTSSYLLHAVRIDVCLCNKTDVFTRIFAASNVQ